MKSKWQRKNKKKEMLQPINGAIEIYEAREGYDKSSY